jgi:hypothetical protein
MIQRELSGSLAMAPGSASDVYLSLSIADKATQ